MVETGNMVVEDEGGEKKVHKKKVLKKLKREAEAKAETLAEEAVDIGEEGRLVKVEKREKKRKVVGKDGGEGKKKKRKVKEGGCGEEEGEKGEEVGMEKDQVDVERKEEDGVLTTSRFDELGFSEPTNMAIKDMEFERMTEVKKTNVNRCRTRITARDNWSLKFITFLLFLSSTFFTPLLVGIDPSEKYSART